MQQGVLAHGHNFVKLSQVEIMMALEEKFDIQLDEEGAEKITTVQEAADLIWAQVCVYCLQTLLTFGLHIYVVVSGVS